MIWAIFVALIVTNGASRLLIMLRIDDPLDAFAVHGACGFWGLLATGLFCTDSNAAYAAYPNACADPSKAADGEECTVACSTFEQFGVQFVGAIVIFLWTAVMSGLLFMALKLTIGMRVEESVEEAMSIVKECMESPFKSRVEAMVEASSREKVAAATKINAVARGNRDRKKVAGIKTSQQHTVKISSGCTSPQVKKKKTRTKKEE